MKKLIAIAFLLVSSICAAETTWYSDGSYSDTRYNSDGSSTTWNSDGSYSQTR